jgi:hypothetical protein
MNRISLILALVALSACGSETVTIRGALASEGEAERVWIVGASESASVDVGREFVLEGLAPGVIDLRFDGGAGEVGRMVLHDVPAGAEVILRDVWFDERRAAFPAAVEVRGAALITINDLVWGSERQLPRDLDAHVQVLAASRDGEAMIVRPLAGELPDLRIVVTPGTVMQTEDGDPVEANRFSFGDSIRLRAQQHEGYMVASEIVTPRVVATRRRR